MKKGNVGGKFLGRERSTPDSGDGDVRDSLSGGPETGGETGTETGGETGTDTGDGIFVEPGTLKGTFVDGEVGGETKKRRGRPPGSGKGKPLGSASTAKAKTVPTLVGIEKILLSMHMMGAALTKVPELALSEEESKQLAESIERVAALYDLGMSEKAIAWSQLLMVSGATYGPRFFAYQLRTKAEAEKRKDKVTPISGPFGVPVNAST